MEEGQHERTKHFQICESLSFSQFFSVPISYSSSFLASLFQVCVEAGGSYDLTLAFKVLVECIVPLPMTDVK